MILVSEWLICSRSFELECAARQTVCCNCTSLSNEQLLSGKKDTCLSTVLLGHLPATRASRIPQNIRDTFQRRGPTNMHLSIYIKIIFENYIFEHCIYIVSISPLQLLPSLSNLWHFSHIWCVYVCSHMCIYKYSLLHPFGVASMYMFRNECLLG